MAKSETRMHREFLKALMRRERHLRERIAQDSRPPLSYDVHEANALRWAIKVLGELVDVQEARIDQYDVTAVR